MCIKNKALCVKFNWKNYKIKKTLPLLFPFLSNAACEISLKNIVKNVCLSFLELFIKAVIVILIVAKLISFVLFTEKYILLKISKNFKFNTKTYLINEY